MVDCSEPTDGVLGGAFAIREASRSCGPAAWSNSSPPTRPAASTCRKCENSSLHAFHSHEHGRRKHKTVESALHQRHPGGQRRDRTRPQRQIQSFGHGASPTYCLPRLRADVEGSGHHEQRIDVLGWEALPAELCHQLGRLLLRGAQHRVEHDRHPGNALGPGQGHRLHRHKQRGQDTR
jgi:hypothetical protein